MGLQSQMIMQNFDHNPNIFHHQHSLNDQCCSTVISTNDYIVADAGCNWFPVSDWMNEMQNIPNRDDHVFMSQNQNAQVDMDCFINFQCEKLRKMVQEQWRMELARLAKEFEMRTLYIMSQKNEQIKQQMIHIMELQQLNTTLQLKYEALQNIATQSQATIECLNQAILQLHEFKNHPMEDVESCCDEADVTSRRESSESSRVICGGCNLREANVVFLPCRHLCACDVCENEMVLCPFCKRHKSSSILSLVF